ncbi:spindle and centriole-associated protein 1 isoform X7 [Gallus gallus]|uniref:spindle and centriole-associated protein 1 isoform X7 n=1 Tax=Gallus gallus TaxID=9031 RepID=UPI001AE5F8CF|nr:spindle and centriole-associated protein 1 isoform X7 [Gallus gallus]
MKTTFSRRSPIFKALPLGKPEVARGGASRRHVPPLGARRTDPSPWQRREYVRARPAQAAGGAAMSLLSGPRPRLRGAARKGPRKATAAKRDWDSTVHDLTVHRATPEDILRRHEIHKSKNKALALLELQEKAQRRKWKKQKQLAPDSLEKRKLALMHEILSDQYDLQDVLKRSDQVMAVVKDLVGNAPRTRTGFPNVTMAPNCDLESSQGPIVQKWEPPTQLSILSESVMDSQSEVQLHEKEMMRQHHEEMLNEHRELIDALTAEILLVREENIAIQKKLQQYVVETDEKMTFLTQAFKGLPLVEPRREESPCHFGTAHKSPSYTQEKPDLSYFESRTDEGKRKNMLKFPQEEHPVKFPQRPCAPGDAAAGRSLPAQVFQPAVLLSPPRQKNSPELSPLQNIYTTISQSTENAERELCKERSSPSPLRTWSVAEENCLMSQRQPVPPTDKDLQSSREKISFSCPGDTTKNDTVGELSQSSDLLGQIAELTRQNSIIKAQLSKFRSFSEDVSDCLPQPDPMQNSNSCPDSSQGQAHLVVPKSLEERIAELNRQSTEARDKLLQLIDQQKLAAADTVSQRIPPVLSPARNYTENARRTIEVSVPVAASVDSSKEDSVSPGSVTSMRRSVGGSSKPSSPLSTTSESVTLNPVSQRPKAEKQKEEGWFALSMHIM